jgi:hypothetical protein
MKEEQTISWIFLATALASQTRPSDFQDIVLVADGINHAVPTHKELQFSLSWLTNQGLINKVGKRYELSQKGKLEYDKASKGISMLLRIWENLELRIKNFS